MIFIGLLKTSVFSYVILGFEYAFAVCFGVIFRAVFGRYIAGCSTLVWLLLVYQNDRKSCDFAVKMFCFIGFRCSYGREINMCGG